MDCEHQYIHGVTGHRLIHPNLDTAPGHSPNWGTSFFRYDGIVYSDLCQAGYPEYCCTEHFPSGKEEEAKQRLLEEAAQWQGRIQTQKFLNSTIAG